MIHQNKDRNNGPNLSFDDVFRNALSSNSGFKPDLEIAAVIIRTAISLGFAPRIWELLLPVKNESSPTYRLQRIVRRPGESAASRVAPFRGEATDAGDARLWELRRTINSTRVEGEAIDESVDNSKPRSLILP